MLPFARLLLLFLLFIVGDTAILSSSQLMSCLANSNNNTNLNCNKKLVVALTLGNNQSVANEYIQVNLSQATNTTSQQTQAFSQPVTIEIRKSQVYILYPLQYLQDFNSKPSESIIFTNIFSCEDGQNSNNPTCGFQYDTTGAKILDSQGYCCLCSFTQIIGTDPGAVNRGKSCGILNLGNGSASAHCLTFSTLWYSGFSILNFQYYYTISISIIDNSNPSSSLNQNLSIGTQNTFAINPDSSVLARVIGDLYPSTPPNPLNNYYLLVPTRPAQNPRVLEVDNLNNLVVEFNKGTSAWMLVDKSMFSMDGLTCDKIGISYTAFRSQSDKCQQQIGSCLTSQIEDLYQQDLEAITAGRKPKYLLSSFGNFIAYQNNTAMSLASIYEGSFSTLITLEISADQLEFITNVGTGTIDLAVIKNFEAFSGNGILQILVTNTGTIAAEFSVAIACDIEVQPIQAQSMFLGPLQSKNITEAITVTTVNNASHTCEIILKNSIASILDRKIVNFTSNALQPKSIQNPNASEVQNASVVQQQVTSCATTCQGFYDAGCFVKIGCWLEFVEFVIILALFMIVLCCFIRYIDCISSCFQKLCCCCCCRCLKRPKKEKFTLPPLKIDSSAISLPLELVDARIADLRRKALTNGIRDYTPKFHSRSRERAVIAPMIKPSTDDLEASYHNSSIISLDQTGIFPQDVNRTENCYAFINFDPEDEIARALGYSSGFSISVLLQIKEDGDVSVIIPSTSGFVLWVGEHFRAESDRILQKVLNAEAIKSSHTRSISIKAFYQIFA